MEHTYAGHNAIAGLVGYYAEELKGVASSLALSRAEIARRTESEKMLRAGTEELNRQNAILVQQKAEACNALDDVRKELVEVKRERDRGEKAMAALARLSDPEGFKKTYAGGYGDAEVEIFHHGIATMSNIAKAAHGEILRWLTKDEVVELKKVEREKPTGGLTNLGAQLFHRGYIVVKGPVFVPSDDALKAIGEYEAREARGG